MSELETPEHELAATLREQIPDGMATVELSEDKWYDGNYSVRLRTKSRVLMADVLDILSNNNCLIEYLDEADNGHGHKWIVTESTK